ncbi:Nitric oxide dioxygenase [Diplonema papillatum]|nr:Nitric oxide dioxygenase [Diplonema papillatum]
MFHNKVIIPFHKENEAAQLRANGRSTNHYGFRTVLPEQHSEFYNSLPFVVLGVSDNNGDMWSTVVTAIPGEQLMSATSTSVVIEGNDKLAAAGDPVLEGTKEGQAIGLLGLEMHTRRRNRLNGVAHLTTQGNIQISAPLLSFGNCPQYITERTWRFFEPSQRHPPVITSGTQLSNTQIQLISSATTFFVSSGHPETGVDASHRGGPPGFVHVTDRQTLLFPDFPGNRQLKTIGNILATSKLGLCFCDFSNGTVLHITGNAEILWCDSPSGQDKRDVLLVTATPDSPSFPAEMNWVAVRLKKVILREHALSVQWTPKIFRNHLTIVQVDLEADSIKSFYLKGSAALQQPLPGQYLPLAIPDLKHDSSHTPPLERTYSISGFSTEQNTYRISIKLQERGVVSSWFHYTAQPGVTLCCGEPQGNFVLGHSSGVKVLVSGGIGITPLLPMLKAAVLQHVGVVWIHSSPTIVALPRCLHKEACEVLSAYATQASTSGLGLIVHQLTNFSREEQTDAYTHCPGEDVGIGRLTPERVNQYLEPLGLDTQTADVYLCGPSGFMSTMKTAFENFASVHSEAFGPSA